MPNRLTVEQRTDMRGIIVVQPTFMPDGGLPVSDGHASILIINRPLSNHNARSCAIQDRHPPSGFEPIRISTA